MARKRRTATKGREELIEPPAPRRGRKRAERRPGGLSETELMSLVCGYFSQGYTASDIKRLLAEQHGITVNREVPHQLFNKAAARGWIQFTPPREHALGEALAARYAWLRDLRVVESPLVPDVARVGAKALYQLLQQKFAGQEVHLGFSGGHGMRDLARALANLLHAPTPDLPRRIVFHALVAGFDIEDPTTDPNTFFAYLVKDAAMMVETGFVGLRTPPVVTRAQFDQLRNLEGVKESFDRARQLSVIVTSARDWRDAHSTLPKWVRGSTADLRKLEQSGIVGDILWRPLTMTGPAECDTERRAMTIMELADLSQFVRDGKEVLLVVGPCAEPKCMAPQSRIVRAVLNQDPRLITRLVVDSRCARELLDGNPQAAPGWSGHHTRGQGN